MSRGTFNDMFSLPGPDEIRRWEEERDRISEAIRELNEKRAYIERLISAARGEPHTTGSSRRVDGKMKPGTWMHTIAQIVFRNPEGLSYDELREQIPGDFGEAIRKNPSLKAFYGALRRLERDEVIVRHRNHAFTPAGYKRYRDKIERGELEEVKGHDYRQSPMADAIKEFLAYNGPSKVVSLRSYLSSKPQFSDSMRNQSAIYNVLKRLVERDELIHNEANATFALAGNEKAPNAPHVGASQEEEVATSSNDTSSLF